MIFAFNIANVAISPYWLAISIGAVAMLVLMIHRRMYFGLSVTKTVVFTFMLTICGLVGTKILYILEHFEEVQAIGVTIGGLSFYGAVFLVPILMPLGCRWLSLDRVQSNDASSLCGLIMLGSMRFGCFLQNCCGGITTMIGNVYFRWPTQAIESVGDFILLAFLLRKERQQKCVGKLYPLFMVYYSILRFFVEFLRDTPKDLWNLSRGQWYALVSILIGSVWLATRSGRHIK